MDLNTILEIVQVAIYCLAGIGSGIAIYLARKSGKNTAGVLEEITQVRNVLAPKKEPVSYIVLPDGSKVKASECKVEEVSE